MRILKLLCLLLMTLPHVSRAQSKLPSMDYVPQSPAAAAYTRYGEIPVDHSTGVPRIEIPIYTVKVGDVQVPISISYHSSGIKVRDVASEVGLGFVLNAGGVITASVLGGNDLSDSRPGFRSGTDIYNAIHKARSEGSWASFNLAYMYSEYYIKQGVQADFFSDRYYYSLCTGESGFFRKDFINDSLRFMPYHPIDVKIQYPFIDVISANGYKHFFRSITSNKDLFALDKVVTENKTDSIQYYYNYYPGFTSSFNIQYGAEWRFQELIVNPMFSSHLLLKDDVIYSNTYRNGGGSLSETARLDSLATRNEVISFQYVKDRQDKHNAGYRLVKITVKDKHSRQTIKTVDLVHSYFGTVASDNLRLRLDKILISGSTIDNVEEYSFDYNKTPLPPYPDGQTLIFHEDYWGYYNGVAKNTLLPAFSIFDIPGVYNFADMKPNAAYTPACILTQVNYPTGGKTIFEYEANSVDYEAAGLRVKKITSYTDATAKAFVKTYEYGESGVIKPVEPTNFKYTQECWVGYQWTDGFGTPKAPVVVGAYHKYVGSSSSMRPITINGAPIIYLAVTEYVGDETTNLGKTVYGYNYEDCETRNPMDGSIDTRFFSPYHSDCGNYVPQLTFVANYKFNNGNYELVKMQENNYTKIKQVEFNTGITFASKITLDNWQCTADQALLEYHRLYDYFSTLVYMDTKGYQEASVLTNSITRDYINGVVALQTTTDFTYDAKYAQLKRKSITTSDGQNLISEYKYPKDFSGSVYQAMVNRHILTPVIEQSEFKGNTHVESVKTDYAIVAGNIIAPTTIQTKNGNDASYKTRIRYHEYDTRGNVLSVSKENDAKSCYIWGYNQTYPVAKIVGADYNTAFSILSTTDKNTLTNPKVTDQQVRTIIQKIRAHTSMSNAMVYTYTYKLLVGMTSMTDENNITTFYEYDTFNRLHSVKDHNGNIVKNYAYHYRQQ